MMLLFMCWFFNFVECTSAHLLFFFFHGGSQEVDVALALYQTVGRGVKYPTQKSFESDDERNVYYVCPNTRGF